MAEELPFGEGASINRPPLFCGLNYLFWKVRMKIFVESLDRGIWDAIENSPFIPKFEKDDVFLLKNLSPNGLMQKTKEQSLISLQKILSPLP